MLDLQRILGLKVFSEADDHPSGPSWAGSLLIVAAAVAYVGIAVALVALFLGEEAIASYAWSSSVVAFTVMSGAAWHLNMRGRAKNGIALAILMFAMLVALQSTIE